MVPGFPRLQKQERAGINPSPTNGCFRVGAGFIPARFGVKRTCCRVLDHAFCPKLAPMGVRGGGFFQKASSPGYLYLPLSYPLLYSPCTG